MKHKIYAAAASVFVLLAMFSAALADYKIKQRMTISGRTVEMTILVKGSRQRTETGGMGANTVTVEQCDLKRDLQINDNKKLYFIEPFDGSSDAASPSTANSPSKTKTQKGGTVTMIYNVTDTGERKQMFGLTARHLKTLMTMQASPNACTDTDMQIETDGWYVDLPSFACPVQPPKNLMMMLGGDESGGCQDKMVMKQTGAGKLGFALSETRTIKISGGDDDDDDAGMPAVSQTIETVEFSTTPLDQKLFDVPAGYKQAKTSQEIFGGQ